MRTFFLAMIIAVLSGSAARAEPANRSKLDYATPLDRLPPAKSAAGNPCAAFGPGFVKVAGTDTCVKVGGAFRVDVVSGGAGAR
jgi:Porin subfamily